MAISYLIVVYWQGDHDIISIKDLFFASVTIANSERAQPTADWVMPPVGIVIIKEHVRLRVKQVIAGRDTLCVSVPFVTH